jgi:hypothetical protein
MRAGNGRPIQASVGKKEFKQQPVDGQSGNQPDQQQKQAGKRRGIRPDFPLNP